MTPQAVATPTAPKRPEVAWQPEPATPRAHGRHEAKKQNTFQAAAFFALVALGFAFCAVGPMLACQEYLFAGLLFPLGLAAGACFAGILTLNFFFEEELPF